MTVLRAQVIEAIQNNQLDVVVGFLDDKINVRGCGS